jgi:ATP-binding cassette, subfamily B, bacterial
MQLPSTVSGFLWYFIRQQKLQFFVVVLTSVVWAINDAFFPFFLKLIVNKLQHYHGAPSTVFHALSGILILLALFWVVAEIIYRTQGVILIYTFPRFRANIRQTTFRYVKFHSHQYFSEHFAGKIAKKLADLPASSQVLLEIVCFNFLTATAGALIIIIFMWATQPIFAGLLLTWLIVHLAITLLSLKKGEKSWQIHSDSVSELSGKIVDVFTNITNVRLFARTQHEGQYLQRFQDEEIRKSKKAMWILELTRVFLGLNGLFLIFGMLFLLLKGWSQGWVSLGDFTQVGMQAFWLLGWAWYVSFQMSMFARESGTIRAALSIINKSHDVVDAPKAVALNVTRGEIVFNNVSFSYQKNMLVFDQLNVSILGGEKVGLVGFSGSGKTTFVNLLLRFYDVDAGKIFIDNQDIAQVCQDSLRSQIAVIPQDPMLFHRTLMENIRYGRLDATDEEVITASKLAHCHEFIEILNDGYHALVGERGIKLSGGQRQRIAIARAILKNAPILMLDEATSALDSVTEKLIYESLHGLMQQRTTLVVAHRLSTLADMDRILVFHHGQIIEDGTQAELLKRNGHFSRLWNMQINGFLPDEQAD